MPVSQANDCYPDTDSYERVEYHFCQLLSRFGHELEQKQRSQLNKKYITSCENNGLD